MKKKVVILSPSPYSLYTITVAEMLRRKEIDVACIVVRRLFNTKRFFREFSRDGARLLKKIWKKFILRKRAYVSKPFETIADLMDTEKIDARSVTELALPIRWCGDFNEATVIDTVKTIQPDAVVFTGGGLIRSELIASSGLGILNCHMGILPKFRGMDVVEWPMLLNEFNMIGTTVHLMDAGVDTGDILRIHPIDLQKGQTISELRDRFEPVMCREIVQGCIELLAGQARLLEQKKEDGKQFYIMHPALLSICQNNLQKHFASLAE